MYEEPCKKVQLFVSAMPIK